MIKGNELRLGNYILYQKEHIIPCDLVDIELSEIDREPVVLAEEILLKCGFKKIKHSSELLIIEIKDGVWLYFDTRTNKLSIDIINGSVYLDIEYLHQLQNLVHALANKELEIKL